MSVLEYKLHKLDSAFHGFLQGSYGVRLVCFWAHWQEQSSVCRADLTLASDLLGHIAVLESLAQRSPARPPVPCVGIGWSPESMCIADVGHVKDPSDSVPREWPGLPLGPV